MPSSVFCEGQKYFYTRPSSWSYMRNRDKQEFFWDKEFLNPAFFFSSQHSSGWVSTSSAKVFVQEAHAQYRPTPKWVLPSSLLTGWKIPNARKGSWAIGHPSRMSLRWISTFQGGASSFEGQAPGWYLSQHAHLLLWEHLGTPCTHCCSPPHHQAEEAQSAGSLERLLWSSQRHLRISYKLLGPRTLSCWMLAWRPARWRLSRPNRCSKNTRRLMTRQSPRCTSNWGTSCPVICSPNGITFLPQDARAWLVGWSKRSSDRREASTHINVLPRLSWAT